MEEKLDGKSWVYHPRAIRARQQAEAEMSEWLLKQEPSPAYRSEVRAMSDSNAAWNAVPIKPKPPMPPKREVKAYECVKCGARWSGTSRHCDSCDTHLFTRVEQGDRSK